MYQIDSEKMFYDMADGQAIVINFTTGTYYGTTSLGSMILDRLVAGYAPDKIILAVKKLDGCPEDISEQIEGFIDQIIGKGILIPGDTIPGGDEDIPDTALADGWELTLDEFDEIQDLLIADPIHDVEVEEGWPVMKN